MEAFFTTEIMIALLTLSAMEIVLGIDNVVFIAIVAERVKEESREKIRKLGIALALVIRVGLLFSISWLMGFTEILFELLGRGWSGRDLILLGGGLFLMWKSTMEMHHKIEKETTAHDAKPGENVKTVHASGFSAIMQILILDVVFSLDSVITAVGMVDKISVMIVAMIIAMVVMLVSAKYVGDFVMKNPTVKILALAFLLLIGFLLVAEATGQHINKGYIYFAMAFSLGVEMLNLRYRRKKLAVKS